MGSPQEFAEKDAVAEDLRRSLDRALRANEKLRRDKEYLRDAVWSAANDAASSISIPKVTKPKADRRAKGEEVAIAMLSDVQLGKVTPDYSTEVARQRVAGYAEKICSIAAVQRKDHPVKDVWVLNMGDFVEGELIFPGQSHRIDASLYRQAITEGPEILSSFLLRLAADFEKVHVVSVIGNHGAIGGPSRREMHPESNADAMCYEVARMLTESEPRIVWENPNSVPGERNWYAAPTIMGKRWFLVHGDQIRGGFAGFPFYGVFKKAMGWFTSVEQFDYLAFGHWHTPTRLTLNKITAWCNGSTESTNTYAQESLGAVGTPSQWLLFSGKDGVTGEYKVRL